MCIDQIDRGFWTLTLSVVLLFICLPLVQHGMFLDGVTYASIARNLALSEDSILHLRYTDTFSNPFYGHLPLAIFLESILFRALGDHFMIERAYCLLIFLSQSYFLLLIWQRIVGSLKHAYLPILILLSMPLYSWCIINNMLENTVSLFSLISIYYLLIYEDQSRFQLLLVAILSCFLAVLSKGFIGLFPCCASIFLYRHWQDGIKASIIFITFLSTLFGLSLLLIPDWQEYFWQYMHIQLRPSFAASLISISSLAAILMELLQQLLIPFGLLFILFFMPFGEKTNKLTFTAFKFFITGLSASLPVMLTHRFSPFYIACSLPYFALAIAVYLSQYKISTPLSIRKIITPSSILILVVCSIICAKKYGSYTRDKVLITSIKSIDDKYHENTLYTSAELSENWILVAYLQRIKGISLCSDSQCDPSDHDLLRLSKDQVQIMKKQ